MGMEAECRVESGGRVSRGRALLEEKDLIFRGDFRLRIPFAGLQSLACRKGILEVVYPGGEARFHLGARRAEQWYLKIRYPRSRLDKLGVKPGLRVWVRGIDDARFLEQLRGRDATILKRKPVHPADLIFLQAEQVKDLAGLEGRIGGMKRNGAIWVLWPKGQKHIKEGHVRKAGKEAGLVDIKVVSFSDRLSGLKLVIPVKDR